MRKKMNPLGSSEGGGGGTEAWAPAGIFVGGSELQKDPPLDEKGLPPQRICASTVFKGLGGMLSEENFNNGALYYISVASQTVFR